MGSDMARDKEAVGGTHRVINELVASKENKQGDLHHLVRCCNSLRPPCVLCSLQPPHCSRLVPSGARQGRGVWAMTWQAHIPQ